MDYNLKITNCRVTRGFAQENARLQAILTLRSNTCLGRLSPSVTDVRQAGTVLFPQGRSFRGSGTQHFPAIFRPPPRKRPECRLPHSSGRSFSGRRFFAATGDEKVFPHRYSGTWNCRRKAVSGVPALAEENTSSVRRNNTVQNPFPICRLATAPRWRPSLPAFPARPEAPPIG